jgi:hypothetical protein
VQFDKEEQQHSPPTTLMENSTGGKPGLHDISEYFGIERAIKKLHSKIPLSRPQKVRNPPFSIPSPSTRLFGSQGHHKFQNDLLLRSVELCNRFFHLSASASRSTS